MTNKNSKYSTPLDSRVLHDYSYLDNLTPKVNKLRILCLFLFMVSVFTIWIAQRNHTLDVHQGVVACEEGWRICRVSIAPKKIVKDSGEDYDSACGEIFRACKEVAIERAWN